MQTTTDSSFSNYVDSMLQYIGSCQMRQEQAGMEKEAFWKAVRIGLGLGAAGGIGYGLTSLIQKGRRENWGRKKDFVAPDTRQWETPDHFWLRQAEELKDDPAYKAQPSATTTFRVPAGTTTTALPANAEKVLSGKAYGVDRAVYRAPIEKSAFKVVRQLGKGLAADTVTGLAGTWGAGGLLKAIGKMLGAQTDVVARKGFDNANILRRGAQDIAEGGTKHLKASIDSLNRKAKVNAKRAQQMYDKADSWQMTTRYMKPGNMRDQGLLAGLGQRIAYAGQKLTDMSDAGQNWYRKGLAKDFGDKTLGNLALRKTIGATSVALPIGYGVASEFQEPGTLWAMPGQALGKAYMYSSLPGLLSQGGAAAGKALEGIADTATSEGARMGAHITAAELANAGRMAYLGGVINPARMSREIAARADAKIDERIATQRKMRGLGIAGY